jgi:KDO2-lipid IV(A) lauroyltransferase
VIARLVLAFIRLAHYLPLGVLARIGRGIGAVAWVVVRPRRRVCLVNLAKCFPEKPEAERVAIAREHFRLLGRFMLEHGIMWHASRERFARIVTYENPEALEAALGRPLIFLAPHFLGLDMAGVRLTLDTELASMYQKQRDPVFDAAIRDGRTRFLIGRSRLFSRQDGVRPVARLIRDGVPFYYLPDLDFGREESIFVPFFGVPTATITGVSRLARIAGAAVVPVVTRMLPGGAGYSVRFHPPLENFPSDDVEADTARINRFIEDRVRELPEQYYWVHKRFKTRPPGEAGFY